MEKIHEMIQVSRIERKIYLIRGQKVMLDTNLAALYGVTAGRLNEAVRRNLSRFPEDFMFQLTAPEFENLKSQIAISSSEWGGRRHPPYAFTEQGVAMLSSVLRSKRAVLINITIMRVFVRMRNILASHKELAGKLDEVERSLTARLDGHEKVIARILAEIRELSGPPPESPHRRIGFHRGEAS